MSVRIANGRFLEIVDGSSAFAPTADEIFSVVHEGAIAIRNVPVSRNDFLATGVEFSEYAASPLVVFQMEQNGSEPRILCKFMAAEGAAEAEISSDGNRMLDYAIGHGRWMPLPLGTLDEAKHFLIRNDLTEFGQISIAQYMRIVRQHQPALIVQDRTANALAAATVAHNLQGDAPAGLKANLYPYQLDGYRWLSFMNRNGLGSIIADEMGLGKTIQVICLLLEAANKGHTPNLVVSPATLLENWRRELARFAPALRVLVHSGSRRTGLPADLKHYDIVVSSFETAVADVSLFRNIHWHTVIVDEAQGIKNPDARRSIQIKTIPRNCSVAITGTPVENRLKDLWSITDFVLPSLLGSLKEFEQRHPDTIAGAESLEPTVSPLMLRRRVAQVAGDLPERIEIPQVLELDEPSAVAYESIRATVDANGPGGGLAALTSLRMFCVHPWLTGKFLDIADAAACSPKFQRLLEVIDEIIETRGKVLIFTSYQESTDLLVAEIGRRFAIPTDFIDGRVPVPSRQGKVDSFGMQTSSAVLVLNPRAAGVGLNITAANHVIHYNLEWNPAVEDQASARAHRRGQTRAVTIHRFFYANTVEDVINDRMARKRELAEAAVVGTDGREQELDDILRALRISPISSS